MRGWQVRVLYGPLERVMKKSKRKVAIFDIDGTIFRSSILIQLVNNLVERGIFPKNAYSEYQKEYRAWLDRHGPYEHYINQVVKIFMKYLKGKKYKDLVDTAKVVAEEQKHRVYRYTRGLIKELKKKGYYLLAISHSPKLALDTFGETHGFDKVYGIRYETDAKEKFTGNYIEFDLIINKASILKRVVEKEELTLKGSVGVGDSEGDISFLSLVEKPICFNPNNNLYKHAKKKKWNIVVERKDVIYEL